MDLVEYNWTTHRDRHFADFWAMVRERGVRVGALPAINATEARQASEGAVDDEKRADWFKTPVWECWA